MSKTVFSAGAFAAFLGLSSLSAQAAVVTRTSEGAFLAISGPVGVESFEAVAPRPLATGVGAAVTVPAFTVSPVGPATLGVQDGPNSPGPGYRAVATDGSHYLLSYQPGLATGTLHFAFTEAITAFGLNVLDVGETEGVVAFRTNAGDGASGFTALEFPPLVADGSVFFFGFTQASAFTDVLLTVTGVDEAFGLDKVYFSVIPTAVPEPASAGLVVLGLGLLGAAARRRQ